MVLTKIILCHGSRWCQFGVTVPLFLNFTKFGTETPFFSHFQEPRVLRKKTPFSVKLRTRVQTYN